MVYRFKYDDPYQILAQKLIGYSDPCDIVRIMFDDAYILNILVKETRSQDMCGTFTDCIIESILENKERMKYMAELDKLAKFYYTKLDKERLREEIKQILKEAGIDLSDFNYPSDCSVLSDKT